jgi:hypothetical protein
MSISTAPLRSARAAFAALIDYAGLFPPARLSPDEAQREYRTARSGAHAWMLGRFIVPASLLASRETFAGPFSVIADGGVAALPALAELTASDSRIEAVELPPAVSVADFARYAPHVRVPVFAEVPRPFVALPATFEHLARLGCGAKLRCGGLTEAAFPSVDEVADFIAAARSANVPFKATAGLHHPVRHRDAATGFVMHGFLNLLAAAALAPRLGRCALESVIAEEAPDAFAFDETGFRWRDESIGVEQIELARRDGFVAYGSCSFAEPVDDLAALAILPSV